MLCKCSKTYYCYDVATNKSNFSCEDLNKCVTEQTGDRPLEKGHRILDENMNLTSTDWFFRINNHAIATYEQNMEGLSSFSPKRKVENDGIHTQTLT